MTDFKTASSGALLAIACAAVDSLDRMTVEEARACVSAVDAELTRRDAERAALRAEVEQLKVKLQTANSDYDKLMADARSISRVREQLERELGLD